MAALPPGTEAPSIPGVELGDGERAVVFYKVTCPTCQLAGPPAERLAPAFPEGFAAVGQDPPERLEEFRATFGDFPAVPDVDPYPISDAYGIRTVPTIAVAGRGGRVVDVWTSLPPLEELAAATRRARTG